MEDKDLILIDKPKGISSFDVIRALRKKLSVRKMGHAGTLDPLATGLMLIGVGSGTKKLKDLIGLDKSYEAEILLGVKTDTSDMEGKILEEKSVESVNKEKVENILKNLIGEIELSVSIYSAIKKDGEALYKKARRGEKIKAPKRKMKIKKAELLDIFSFKDKQILKVRFEVGSGTYIRSLAEKIGEELGLPATIKELRRLSVGKYSVKDAEKI